MDGTVCFRGRGGRGCERVERPRGLGLALPQPVASLVVAGDVGWLPRNWPVDVGRPLAIFADIHRPRYCDQMLEHLVVRRLLKAGGFTRPSELPGLAIIGAVDQVVACTPRAELEPPRDLDDRKLLELIPGDWVWQLDGARRFAEPVPCEGWWGLQRLEPELGRKVVAEFTRRGGQ